MIHHVLGFLKNQLNQYLKNLDALQEDKVVFINNGERADIIVFPKNAITPLLINLEEENLLRASDPYVQVRANGTLASVNPQIRLNMFVLFACNFTAYEESLKYLSYILKFFQSNRLFDHERTPQLTENVEQIIMELVTMNFSGQNEVWSALRTNYVPSVLYKVKMIVFEDDDARMLPQVTAPGIKISLK